MAPSEPCREVRAPGREVGVLWSRGPQQRLGACGKAAVGRPHSPGDRTPVKSDPGLGERVLDSHQQQSTPPAGAAGIPHQHCRLLGWDGSALPGS